MSGLSVFSPNKMFLDGIVISHLPDGPTAHFKLTSVKLGRTIKVRHVTKTNILPSDGLILYTLTSVCIFSILFSIHFL